MTAGLTETRQSAPVPAWRAAKLSEVADITSGGTPSRNQRAFWGGRHLWVTTAEVDGGTINTTRETISDEGLARSSAKLLPPGTVLMAMYGQGKTRGKVAILGTHATTNQACAAILPGPEVDGRYLFHLLSGKYDEIRRMSNSGSQENLSLGIVGGISVLLPTLAEQYAIAEALDSADQSLSAIDELIVKKRGVKQALSVGLLSGQLRTAGDDSTWSVRQFGELCKPRKDRIDPRLGEPGVFCVELEHLESGTGRLLASTVTSTTSSLKTSFQAGDVLFGKLRSYLRKSWQADRAGVCSTEIWALAPHEGVAVGTFIAQLVQTDAFVEATQLTYGTHMPRSDWSAVARWECPVPSVEVQRSVGELLAAADAELDALVAQRDKLRMVKQGMMQDLLSGRVRLS